KLGVSLPIIDISGEPATVREFAQAAEEPPTQLSRLGWRWPMAGKGDGLLSFAGALAIGEEAPRGFSDACRPSMRPLSSAAGIQEALTEAVSRRLKQSPLIRVRTGAAGVLNLTWIVC